MPISNMNPDDIDKLQAGGFLSPETANQLKGQIQPAPASVPDPSVGPAPDPASLNPAAASNPPLTADYGSQPAMSGTQTDQQAPITSQPTAPPSLPTAANEPKPLNPDDFLKANSSQSQLPNTDDKRLKGIEHGYQMRQDATKEGAEAGAQLANETAAVLQKSQENAEKMETQRLANEQNRQAQYEKELGVHRQISDQLLNSKEDPDRWWNSRSTGQKVMAGIGMILGGIGGGMTGSNKNAAMDVINKAIDDDINAQKGERDKLSKVAGIHQNLMDVMRSKFSDERQAEAAARATALERVQMQVQQLAAKYKAPEIQAQAKALGGELESQRNATMMQFEQASKLKQLQAQQLGNMDQITQGITTRVPKDLQKDAFKEKGDLENAQQRANDASKLWEELYKDVSPTTGMPGPNIKESTKRFEARWDSFIDKFARDTEGRVVPTTVELLKGLKPRFDDTRSGDDNTKTAKLNQIRSAIMSTVKTPILTGHKIFTPASQIGTFKPGK
jgi:hypothetical protein